MEKHKDLIDKSKSGDSRAQHKLYRLYSRSMFNTAIRMMGKREEAEDILQESFTDAFMNLDTFRHESNFGNWLKRILINKCLNELNRRKVDLMYLDNLAMFDQQDLSNEERPSKYDIGRIKNAMNKLPAGARTIFSLYLFEGYDHQEISQILDISVSNSKTQYHRAKIRIRKILLEKAPVVESKRIFHPANNPFTTALFRSTTNNYALHHI